MNSFFLKVAKEKALQLERKRKAAQFLAQLAEKKTTVSSVTPISGDPEGDSSAEEGEIPGGGGGAETDSHVSVPYLRDSCVTTSY